MEQVTNIDLVLDHSLKKRIITGTLLVTGIALIVLFGMISFLVFILVLNGMAINEYCLLVRKMNAAVQKIAAITAGTAIIGITLFQFIYRFDLSLYLLLIPMIGLIFISELFRRSERPFENISLSIVPLTWISIPVAFYLAICFYPFAQAEYNSLMALSYFIILWSGDTGAFFTGKLIGKHLLFKRISPKKTWEGSMGGLLFAVMAAFIDFKLFGIFPLNEWLVLACIINITGTFGDFIKSMLKRSVGVKDTGNILPGHGGILDRFDTLIGSTPFAFIYIYLYV